MIRAVEYIYKAFEIRMGQIQLHQALPFKDLEQVSPFILLHHFDFYVEPGHNAFYVPPHPHRGFCPVTYIFDGSIFHRDSRGNDQEIHAYEVQWITAGNGIIHSEGLSPSFIEKGGRLQGIQLWINLPARRKLLPAKYQPLSKEEIVIIEGNHSRTHLVSGQIGKYAGPAESAELTAMVEIEPGGSCQYDFDAEHNCLAYILEGEVTVNGESKVKRFEWVLFKNEPGEITFSSDTPVKMLLICGRPIPEPMVSHGPYVMNTETEIMEAMRDYQNGRMGYLYA